MIRFSDNNSFYSESAGDEYGAWMKIEKNLIEIRSENASIKPFEFGSEFPYVLDVFDFVPTFDLTFLDGILERLANGKEISKFE